MSASTLKDKGSSGRRPSSGVWSHFIKGNEITAEKYSAKYKYCNESWNIGKLWQLESHLANHCTVCYSKNRRTYLQLIIDKNATKSQNTLGLGQQSLSNFMKV